MRHFAPLTTTTHISARANRPKAKTNNQPGRATATVVTARGHMLHDFSRIPVHAPGPHRQRLNSLFEAEDDRAEREADLAAKNSRYATRADTASADIVWPFDFSQVRVHIDSYAAAANRRLNAKAFTFGRDIYFATGEFDVGRATSRALLVHEMMHVLQQHRAGVTRIQRQRKGPDEKPLVRGALTEDQYLAWLRTHPKATTTRVGPWMPAAVYKQFTNEYFKQRGFVRVGRMIRDYSSGGYDEIWLSDAGDGKEYQVYREPMRAKAPASRAKQEEDQDDVDPDLLEAENLLKDTIADKRKVLDLLRQAQSRIGFPDYDVFHKRYQKARDDWLSQLDTDTSRVTDLLSENAGSESEDELRDIRKGLTELRSSWPFGDEWKAEKDLPGEYQKVIQTKGPITF
jgi:Domain of unknown function (DUF4157)